jgi:hypothetical protein
VSTLRGAAALTIALETAFLLSPKCNVEKTFPELCGETEEQTAGVEPDTDDSQQQISEWAADD